MSRHQVSRSAATAALIAIATACCGSPPPQSTPKNASANRLLVTDVAIVSTDSGTISSPTDILVVDGLIKEVGALRGGEMTDGAMLVSGKGLYALAGLIDVHAHLGDGGIGKQTRVDRAGTLPQFLRYGVTSIFVPGGRGGNDVDLARWKEQLAAKELTGPRLFGAGALLTAPGGHPISTLWNLGPDASADVLFKRGAIAVTGQLSIDELLDRKVESKVDAIKIIIEDWGGEAPRLSRTQIEALAHAGHARGLKVFAHVSTNIHVRDAVAAGVDGVMHSSEDTIDDETLARMAEAGIFYVATLCLYDGFFDRATGETDEEPFAKAGVSKRALESLASFGASPFENREQREQVAAALQANLRRVHSVGAPLAVGTDVGNPSVFPGYSVHEEMALMVEAGLTPREALHAATIGGAAFLERSDALGRIAPGYRADFILLGENPLEDILNTRSLRTVIADGRLVPNVVTAPQP